MFLILARCLQRARKLLQNLQKTTAAQSTKAYTAFLPLSPLNLHHPTDRARIFRRQLYVATRTNSYQQPQQRISQATQVSPTFQSPCNRNVIESAQSRQHQTTPVPSTSQFHSSTHQRIEIVRSHCPQERFLARQQAMGYDTNGPNTDPTARKFLDHVAPPATQANPVRRRLKVSRKSHLTKPTLITNNTISFQIQIYQLPTTLLFKHQKEIFLQQRNSTVFTTLWIITSQHAPKKYIWPTCYITNSTLFQFQYILNPLVTPPDMHLPNPTINPCHQASPSLMATVHIHLYFPINTSNPHRQSLWASLFLSLSP